MGIIIKNTGGYTFLKFVKMLLTAFQTLNNSFFSYTNSVREALQYTSQVAYLQRLLNDTFDPINRGIYVANQNTIYQNYKYDVLEGFGGYMYDASEGSGRYMILNGETTGDYSFVIFIPVAVSYDSTFLRSLVNSYIFADKTFDIIQF